MCIFRGKHFQKVRFSVIDCCTSKLVSTERGWLEIYFLTVRYWSSRLLPSYSEKAYKLLFAACPSKWLADMRIFGEGMMPCSTEKKRPEGSFAHVLLILRNNGCDCPSCPFLSDTHYSSTYKVSASLIMPSHGAVQINHYEEYCTVVKGNSDLIKARMLGRRGHKMD